MFRTVYREQHKVPKPLRERISRDAAQRGITAAALLTELVDAYERRGRLEAVGRAYAAWMTPIEPRLSNGMPSQMTG